MNIVIPIIILAGGVAACFMGKLTPWGSLTGIIIAMLVFYSVGLAGVLGMVSFFILGTAATSWRSTYKEKTGISKIGEGMRNMGQVLANGGAAGLISIMALLAGSTCFWAALVAATFASATADTLSSELGTLYGKRFYNILSFKKDQRGLDGVISLEGTLIGIGGSCIVALIHCFSCGWDISFILIVIAGTIGNLADSVLGASLERSRLIGNNAVNFLNTAIAAISYYLLFLVFQQ